MPELPEVQTVTTALNIAIKNLIVKKVGVMRKSLRLPIPKKLKTALIGSKVINVTRRAKYGIINFDNDYSIIFHLGMSGRIIIEKNIFPKIEKHDHIIFDFMNPQYKKEKIRFVYRDPRRFGFFLLYKTYSIKFINYFKNIGPEPLNKGFPIVSFIKVVKSKNTSIKTALLNQSIIAGLGNIYVCESLFLAGIRPTSICKKLSYSKIEFLYFNIVKVLKKAINEGGTSIKDHKNISGEIGYFQNFLSVYNRKGEECINNDCNQYIKKIAQNGRSSFYCQNCQK